MQKMYSKGKQKPLQQNGRVEAKEEEACRIRESNQKQSQQRQEEKRSISQLRNQLNASLEKNCLLRMENEQLKKELLHLKIQIASLQPQVVDNKSVSCNKLQSNVSSDTSPKEKADAQKEDSAKCRQIFLDRTTSKQRSPRVPKPPPTNYSPSIPKSCGKEANSPPPAPPPPPPPIPLQTRGMLSSAVRRLPEVMELHRSLTRKGGCQNTKTAIIGIPSQMHTRDMIGEIENRSAFLLAVKSDVVSQAELINFLSREVENAAYKDISDVETFVRWLDEELSYLVDERAVLKHFSQWPELKADAMREAAFNYRDLKNLELEISCFHDDIRQSTSTVLKLIKALQDKLESSVHNLEKVRESTSKKYRDFKIPWQWMLNTGIISQLKLGSLKLVKMYMRRVVTALQTDVSSEEQDLLLQGVKFAFQVHQFAGGFDEGSRHAFQELQKMASSYSSVAQKPE